MKIRDRLYDYHFDSVQAISELDKNEKIDISHLVYGFTVPVKALQGLGMLNVSMIL